MALINKLLGLPEILQDPVARELVFVLTGPTGKSSAGYPYLGAPAWRRFRDWVPHILDDGMRVLDASERILDVIREEASPAELASAESARDVIRQVVLTAAITAPPDLYVLRWVIAGLQKTGVAAMLLDGQEVIPDSCGDLLGPELAVDLRFLVSRGYLARTPNGFRLLEHETARRILQLPPPESDPGPGAARDWMNLINEDSEESAQRLRKIVVPEKDEREAGEWPATASDCLLAAQLVPLVLGMRAAGVIPSIEDSGRLDPKMFGNCGEVALSIFRSAGLCAEDGSLNVIGHRVLSRGIGPFGIIAAYHPYLAQLPKIFREGRGAVHVQRDTNIAASQDANARTFSRANEALDRFCRDHNFNFEVFIEHAMGRGEAIRQRYSIDGSRRRYVGADLEDAAIDAAELERDAGRLPSDILLIRNADIGKPSILLEGMRKASLSPRAAVMIVGNGFHEVREQTDEFMTAILKEYCEAGILLLFTEESALSADDLLETAWNTYHAGFKYVHERSGQGLRPASPGPAQPLEGRPPASWTECAHQAGYVEARQYKTRGRTVYPYTPPSGHNPAISVNHFFVPASLAKELNL